MNAYGTCDCLMTWGCKQTATGDDGLCDECRAECARGDSPTSAARDWTCACGQENTWPLDCLCVACVAPGPWDAKGMA